ncbi:hypothetical protein SSX86_029028 [Deinandra increscens subsp. villosa]|uniref:DUF1421 domain-containing protein n=1 Tax=Deinandra increscens subsp. villosa TaxID=3103831 RepID=A0AAP0C8T4_9ASTR
MNTSQFMDKQIMDLSNSQNKNTADTDFMDLNIHPPQEDHHLDAGDGGDKKDEILPNYDFQPIRPIVPSQLPSFDSSNVGGGARAWSSAEFEPNYGSRKYGSLDSVEPSKVVVEKDRTVLDAALISEIDRTMKKHADNLLHALEGVSARLSQLETRSRNLEKSVDDLRTSVGNNHGNTDGKLRQIENIIREVQSGVQVVKDKQEILETQLQLSQVQISKSEQQLGSQNVGHMESLPQQAAVASAPLQSYQQLPPAALAQPHSATLPNAPPPPNPQPTQFSQSNMPMPISHRDSYFPPPGQTADAPPPQHYQMPLPPQQLQPPMASPPSPRPQYQPPTQIQYSQPPPMSLQQPNPSQSQPPSSHLSEELAYLTSQNYPQGARQPGGGPPAQQFHGNPSQMYEPPPPPPPSVRTGPGFPSQYGPSPGYGESYGYSGSQYGSGSPVKSQQHSSTNMGPGGGSGYPQLPTARVLPQALPTAAAVGGTGSSSGSSSGSGNRVPIDDVVDKVTNMGFSRDQVRATVRKLTENGQAVDLNIVLDKLMTDGVESQNPRPWFGR